MSSLNIGLSDFHGTQRSRTGKNIDARGVILKERWGNTCIEVPDRYAAQYPLDLRRFHHGNIVQLKIKDELKRYAYRLTKHNRPNRSDPKSRDHHMEYVFTPCYNSARMVNVMVPYNDVHSADYYYGLQEPIQESDLDIYSIADDYLLSKLGRPELVISQKI